MRNLLGYKGVKENSKTIFNLIQSNNLWFMSPVPYHWGNTYYGWDFKDPTVPESSSKSR